MGKPKRILFIDNDPSFEFNSIATLFLNGFHVFSANSIAEAELLLDKSNTYSHVICDIRMDDESPIAQEGGLEFLTPLSDKLSMQMDGQNLLQPEKPQFVVYAVLYSGADRSLFLFLTRLIGFLWLTRCSSALNLPRSIGFFNDPPDYLNKRKTKFLEPLFASSGYLAA